MKPLAHGIAQQCISAPFGIRPLEPLTLEIAKKYSYAEHMRIAYPAIRKAAVEAYLYGKATQQQLTDIFWFHRTAIVRWVREYRKNGTFEP